MTDDEIRRIRRLVVQDAVPPLPRTVDPRQEERFRRVLGLPRTAGPAGTGQGPEANLADAGPDRSPAPAQGHGQPQPQPQPGLMDAVPWRPPSGRQPLARQDRRAAEDRPDRASGSDGNGARNAYIPRERRDEPGLRDAAAAADAPHARVATTLHGAEEGRPRGTGATAPPTPSRTSAGPATAGSAVSSATTASRPAPAHANAEPPPAALASPAALLALPLPVPPAAPAPEPGWERGVAETVAALCHGSEPSFHSWTIQVPLDAAVLPHTQLRMTFSRHHLLLRFNTESTRAFHLISAHQPRLRALLADALPGDRHIDIELT